MLLALRGTPILYYGDELGMEQVEIPEDEQLDTAHSRDGARTPMPWTSTADHEWWIRHGDLTRNVEDMRADESSTPLVHAAAARVAPCDAGARPRLIRGLDAPSGVWAWRRGEGCVVAVNLSDRPQSVQGVQGSIRLDTGLARIGEEAAGSLRLAPWEGALVGN